MEKHKLIVGAQVVYAFPNPCDDNHRSLKGTVIGISDRGNIQIEGYQKHKLFLMVVDAERMGRIKVFGFDPEYQPQSCAFRKYEAVEKTESETSPYFKNAKKIKKLKKLAKKTGIPVITATQKKADRTKEVEKLIDKRRKLKGK